MLRQILLVIGLVLGTHSPLLLAFFLLGIIPPTNAQTPTTPPAFALCIKKIENTGGWCQTDDGDLWLVCETGSCTTPHASGKVTDLGGNRWSLDVKNVSTDPSRKISLVYFPWDTGFTLNENTADDYVYDNFHLGSVSKADDRPYYTWAAFDYPGGLASPFTIVADKTDARIVAATNWPPKKVSVQWARKMQVLVYNNEMIPAGESRSYEMLRASVTADPSKGELAWMKAASIYKLWMQEKVAANGLTPDYPEWMRLIHGNISFALQNVSDQDLKGSAGKQILDWETFGEKLPWILFWGQMSDYAAEKTYFPQRFNPATEERLGCCTLFQELDERYTYDSDFSIDLLSRTAEIRAQGGHVGYYSRPEEKSLLDDPATLYDGMSNKDWLIQWLSVQNEDWNADTDYIDTLAAGYYGDPLTIAQMLKSELPFSMSTVEGAVDIYPAVFMVSNSLHYPGGGRSGGPEDTMESLDTAAHKGATIPFPQLGTFVLDDRIFLNGISNGQHALWGAENDYWIERKIFLLGHKFESGMRESWSEPTTMNRVLSLAIDLRDEFGWWAREPRYRDREGLTGVPDGIDARRFIDKDGVTLLAFDNWNELTGLTVTVDSESVNVPPDRLSLVEVSFDRDNDGHASGQDCDDASEMTFPGAPELCDGKDNDCDGQIDENAGTVWYRDSDGDGHGNPLSSQTACSTPLGFVTSYDDCNDANTSINPMNTETCDGVDNNCNGQVDENLSINTYYADGDKDGYGAAAQTSCQPTPPAGTVTLAGDCDDANAAIKPGSVETCDAKDNDCDGLVDENLSINTYYADGDKDGYGAAAQSSCQPTPPAGTVTLAGDCNDASELVNPSAPELCDGKDNDCDGQIDDNPSEGGTYYKDSDGDGFGVQSAPTQACSQPAGYAAASGDNCPTAANADQKDLDGDKLGDACDNDRDGDGVLNAADNCPAVANATQANLDGDAYGDACDNDRDGDGVVNVKDCAPMNKAIYPGATEIIGNGKDDNCDGIVR